MARYTCVLTVNTSMSGFKELLRDILEACNFRIVHEAGDYLMASEIPGQVEFMKLVTAEVLIDQTQASEQELQMKCVVKNEELPLHADNHCRQVFERINRAIAQNDSVKCIQSVTG